MLIADQWKPLADVKLLKIEVMNKQQQEGFYR